MAAANGIKLFGLSRTKYAKRAKVKQTHGDNKHGKVYALAADLAEAQIDTTPIEEETEDGNNAAGRAGKSHG